MTTTWSCSDRTGRWWGHRAAFRIAMGDPVESVQVLATKTGRYSVRVIEANAEAPRELSLLLLGSPDRGEGVGAGDGGGVAGAAGGSWRGADGGCAWGPDGGAAGVLIERPDDWTGESEAGCAGADGAGRRRWAVVLRDLGGCASRGGDAGAAGRGVRGRGWDAAGVADARLEGGNADRGWHADGVAQFVDRARGAAAGGGG